MKKTTLACLLMAACALGADEIKILSQEPLASEQFILKPGEEKVFTAKEEKETKRKNGRLGLRTRVFIQHGSYGGWSLVMRILVNGRVVNRLTPAKQPRLINRPEPKKMLAKNNFRGESWYHSETKSWDVCFGPDFVKPPKRFSMKFAEDVTDYIFDIDDLAAAKTPVQVTFRNIADQFPGIMALVKEKKYSFNLVFGSVELIHFTTSAETVPVKK